MVQIAWSAPKTYNVGDVLTASDMNTYQRDNLLETAPAKASAAGDIFTASGSNAIQRVAIGAAGQVPEVNSAANNLQYSDIAMNLDVHRVMDY